MDISLPEDHAVVVKPLVMVVTTTLLSLNLFSLQLSLDLKARLQGKQAGLMLEQMPQEAVKASFKTAQPADYSTHVAGAVLVKFQAQAGAFEDDMPTTDNEASQPVKELHKLKGKTPEAQMLIEKLKSKGIKTAEKIAKRKDAVPGESEVYKLTFDQAVAVSEEIKALTVLPEVVYAHPDYSLSALAVPNDQMYPYQWNLPKIKAEQAWDVQQGSNNITVAVIDSGIDYAHADLPLTIQKGYDYIDNDADPMDVGGHGTFVAGQIGAQTNNGNGMSGLNWQVKLMAVRVLVGGGRDYERGTLSGLLSGMTYAVDNGAQIINLSLVTVANCADIPALQDVITYANQHNVVVVAGAGNDRKDAALYSPASCSNVITVGATTPTDTRAEYSNYGSVVDLAAPGGDFTPCTTLTTNEEIAACAYNNMILSAWTSQPINPEDTGFAVNGYYYNLIQGTSMSAPQVSGVAALMLAANPALTPADIEETLKTTGDPITTDFPIGGIRLNTLKAIQAVTPGGIPPTPTPSATPTPVIRENFIDLNGDGSFDILDYRYFRNAYQNKQ